MRTAFATITAGAITAVVGLTVRSCGLTTLGLLAVAFGATLLTRQARDGGGAR